MPHLSGPALWGLAAAALCAVFGCPQGAPPAHHHTSCGARREGRLALHTMGREGLHSLLRQGCRGSRH